MVVVVVVVGRRGIHLCEEDQPRAEQCELAEPRAELLQADQAIAVGVGAVEVHL